MILSTTVLGGPNITQNAENALTILYGQCQSSANLISITSGNLWNTYATDIAREVDDYVTKDHAKIKLVVNKLINIANVTVNGETCISEIKGLLNSTNYTLDVTSRERATFF
ncbi:hypothetical protein NQ314_013644 [Rhamnusium bicolor]|uniref:Pectinesterase inhibitor domain-containing protein n=1 Tax=Rhamnusium bicolor TaxID=1586634 RepID=A0AAV8X5K9_9CUCU|nr:hypothetical protein NQ314_013644 [Rhamnusium bicolor]